MKHTEATKAKLSAMRTGALNPFYGRKHTPEVLAAMRGRSRAQNAQRRYDIRAVSITIPAADLCAYIAGLVDGEGSIAFKKGQPAIYVYNCHRGALDWLVATVGGVNCVADRRGREPNYRWSIGGARNCFALLAALQPYLIIKKGLAETMMSRLLEKYGDRIHG